MVFDEENYEKGVDFEKNVISLFQFS